MRMMEINREEGGKIIVWMSRKLIRNDVIVY